MVRVRHDRDERRFLHADHIGCFPDRVDFLEGRDNVYGFLYDDPDPYGCRPRHPQPDQPQNNGTPSGLFSEERKGDIIARVSGDVNEIETSIMSSLDMLFKNPILILIYLIGMIAISWQLTLFVFILLPFAGYVMGTVGKKLKRKSFEGQQQWGYLMSQIEETLGGLRVIKAFNAEAKIQDRFEKSNETFRRLTNRIYRRQQMAHPMSEFLGTATIAIVLWYGGTLILSSNSPIDASTFIYYLVIFTV